MQQYNEVELSALGMGILSLLFLALPFYFTLLALVILNFFFFLEGGDVIVSIIYLDALVSMNFGIQLIFLYVLKWQFAFAAFWISY